MKKYARPSSVDPTGKGPSVAPAALAGLAAPSLIAGAVGYAVGKRAVKAVMESRAGSISLSSLMPIDQEV